MTSLNILNILYGQVFDICFVTEVCFHSSSTKNSLVLKKRLLSRIFFENVFFLNVFVSCLSSYGYSLYLNSFWDVGCTNIETDPCVITKYRQIGVLPWVLSTRRVFESWYLGQAELKPKYIGRVPFFNYN